MPVPPEIRLQNYTDALQGERVPANIKDRIEQMIQQYEDYIFPAVTKEEQTIQVLNNAGIPGHLRPAYHASVREGLRIFRRYNNNPPDPEINAWRQKWISYGLDEQVIDQLYTEVIKP